MNPTRAGSGVLLVAAAGLAIGLLAPAAQAQNALGDGHALDRNLQQGSGGVNTRVRDIQATIRFNNAIVTGNVPGRSLQADVGYVSADELRAALGTNDLYTFRRDSSLSTLGATSIRGTDAIRYQFQLATGQATSPYLSDGLAIPRSQAGTIGSELGGASSGAMRSTAEFLTARSVSPAVLFTRQQAEGLNYAITASPLLGIRQVPLDVPRTPRAGRGAELNVPLSVTPDTINGVTPTVTPATGPDGMPTTAPGGMEAPGSSAVRRPAWAFTGYESLPRGVARPQLTPPGTTAEPGSPLSMDTTAPTSQVTGVQNQSYLQVITKVKQELEAQGKARKSPDDKPGADRSGAAPGEPGAADDPTGLDQVLDWKQRLNSMRRTLRNEPEPIAKPDAESPVDPATGRPAVPADDPRAAPSPLRTPAEEAAVARARQEERLKEFRRRALAAGRELDKETVDALRRSRMVVDDLAKPVGEGELLAYSEHIAHGQKLMAEGQYFDAEERFSRALATLPGDPMAQVGRVHAQIASGLYLSAAINLRNLLKDRPELVATRYGAKLLPAPGRWEVIGRQLRSRIAGDDPSAAEASALLLAYMGYQFDDAAAVNDGLGALSKLTPPDDEDAPLVALLRGVWTIAEPDQDVSK